jgi:hypothetical protein
VILQRKHSVLNEEEMGDQKKRQTKVEVVRGVREARRTGCVQNLVN